MIQRFFFSDLLARSTWAIGTILVLVANWYVFTVVPNEAVMGAAQRIFYFHVGAAMVCYLFIAIVFCGSVLYLLSEKGEWDMIADGAASTAFMFCTITLASGMIWGHSAWNTWWRWEPRLVSFLVLWLVLFSLCLLRELGSRESRQSRFAAVLGIFSAVNVPIVIFSIRLLSAAEQLHPQVIANQGLRDARFGIGLALSTIALVFVGALFFGLKVRTLATRERALELEAKLSHQRA